MTDGQLSELIQKYGRVLMAIPGVEGVGEGVSRGKPCIRVFVSSNKEELVNKMPESIEEYPLIIEEVGKFKAV